MSTIKATTLSTLTGSYSTGTERCIRGAAAAWVNFNGTGVVAIRDSYNVSSITDIGAGNYRINFTGALSSTNYSFSSQTSDDGIAPVSTYLSGTSAGMLVTSFIISTVTTSTGAGTDRSFVGVAVNSN